jgi:hypothetical protein
MNKVEKRKEIIASLEQVSSANEEFSQILDKKKNNIIELDILESLDGNLNLAILTEKGFIKLEILRFSPGNITSLTNIPDGLKTLIINDNLLEEINLPDSIEHIDIGNNVLKGEFDFIRNTLLKYIRVSYNQLSSLENLSENLEELYCDHNILSSLNLKNTTRLSVLHCNYNSKLVLHDLPDTLIDTNLPEQRIQVENTKIKTTKEYLDSLRKYFNLKNEYETELMDLKRKAKSKKRILKTLPSCIGCSRKVGMVFSGKDQKYMAYCGDSAKPCDWKIVIHRGDFYSFLETIEVMRDNLEETKENIIRQKMDTLFQYITEEKSADLFKKQLSFFKTNTEMVEKYYQDYLDIYFSASKKEIVELKQKKIQEWIVKLQQHLLEGELEEVVRIQCKEIQPIAKYIQGLNYPFMEIDKDKKTSEWILDQRDYILSDVEINQGEPISVKTLVNVSTKKDTIKSLVPVNNKDTVDDFFNDKKEGDLWDDDDENDDNK